MAQHARPIGPTTNAAATFGPEMAFGHGRDKPIRYESRNRAGLSVSQTTPVTTFSVEMAQGWAPSEPINSKPFSRGGVVTPPDVPSFSIEMVVGALPSQPRILLGVRIPLPVSQTTHDAAAFSVEMAAGSIPQRNRAFVFPKIGWTVSQTTPVAAFSVESAAGVTAPRMRYTAPFHQGVSLWTPDVLVFSIDMVVGSRPDRPRLTAGKQIGQPVSQTTHVSAPFSSPMAYGVTWQRPHWVVTKATITDIAAWQDAVPSTTVLFRRTYGWRVGGRTRGKL